MSGDAGAGSTADAARAQAKADATAARIAAHNGGSAQAANPYTIALWLIAALAEIAGLIVVPVAAGMAGGLDPDATLIAFLSTFGGVLMLVGFLALVAALGLSGIRWVQKHR